MPKSNPTTPKFDFESEIEKYIIPVKDRIVNVKQKNMKKNGYTNLKDWCSRKNHVYIGRKQVIKINRELYPPRDPYFANSISYSRMSIDDDKNHDRYKMSLRLKASTDFRIRRELINIALNQLKLGCHCTGWRCHANAVIDISNEFLFDEISNQKIDRHHIDFSTK